MTPNNTVPQAMAATPIAPGVHAEAIIAVAGNGPVEDSNDGVVEYSSSHLDGVDSEYIVRSTHSVQSKSRVVHFIRSAGPRSDRRYLRALPLHDCRHRAASVAAGAARPSR